MPKLTSQIVAKASEALELANLLLTTKGILLLTHSRRIAAELKKVEHAFKKDCDELHDLNSKLPVIQEFLKKKKLSSTRQLTDQGQKELLDFLIENNKRLLKEHTASS